jgi:hypothetical protein
MLGSSLPHFGQKVASVVVSAPQWTQYIGDLLPGLLSFRLIRTSDVMGSIAQADAS